MKTSEYSEPDTGEKEGRNMNKKTIYTDAPRDISRNIIEGEIIPDFLPPPEQLVRKESKVKITITLNSKSVAFFKEYAGKHNIKYQTMINEVLDLYVQKYKDRIKI
jgi:predicted DNA binding CopG/RHH family protein